MLPKPWNRYTVPKSLTVITWMQDFSDRIKQLQKLSDAGNTQGPIGFKSIPVSKLSFAKRKTSLPSCLCAVCLIVIEVFLLHSCYAIDHLFTSNYPPGGARELVHPRGLHHRDSPVCGAG